MIYFYSLYKTVFTFLFLSFNIFLIQKQLMKNQDQQQNMSRQIRNINDEYQNLRFLKSNQKKIKDYFEQAKKNGFLRKNKSQEIKNILDDVIKNNDLIHLKYKMHPEKIKTLSNFSYKVTNLSFEMQHYHDKGIFQFLKSLSEQLPGILIPEQLALSRLHDLNASGVAGFYHCSLVTLSLEL